MFTFTFGTLVALHLSLVIRNKLEYDLLLSCINDGCLLRALRSPRLPLLNLSQRPPVQRCWEERHLLYALLLMREHDDDVGALAMQLCELLHGLLWLWP